MTVSSAKPRAKGRSRASKPRAARTGDNSEAPAKIRFRATLSRPATKAVAWTFLKLPRDAGAELPSRGMTSVEGTFNAVAFQATLEPDGQGGHWLKVDPKLRDAAGAEKWVTLCRWKLHQSPRSRSPRCPQTCRRALAAADPKARAAWSDITPAARRDWIQWIDSAKREETRLKRIASGCDMLAQGKHRPCCFDRSGMYAKNLSCPVADEA